MSPKKTADYGVVVVSFSSGPVLQSFLASLAKSDILPRHVVIVENGPSAPETPKRSAWTTSVVHRPDNPGYGSAVNAGIEAMPKDIPWVLIANPDVTLEKGAISALLAEAATDATIGSVGPALLNPDGTVYPSARAVPGLGIGIGHALLGAVWKTNPWTQAYRGTYGSESPRECGWLSGACLLVSRKAFDKVGGFDAGFFMFMEDVDLGMRFGQAGWRNVYVPSARASHTVGHATKSVKPLMATAHHDSAKRFVATRYPGPQWLPVRGLVNLGLSLRLALVQAYTRLPGNQDHAN